MPINPTVNVIYTAHFHCVIKYTIRKPIEITKMVFMGVDFGFFIG